MDGHEVVAGQVLGGKYRVERVLGQGGMGTVLLAHHLELDLQVAIKVLSGGLAQNGEVVARFTREARAAAKLQSDHVVKVSDVGRFEGVGPYMVMEYLRGADLGSVLDERGPLPVAEAVDFVLEAIDALAEAHARGIVHRDIKPQNLFLASRDDGSRRVKVLDFGISKIDPLSEAGVKLTSTRAVMGSPAYMSPEQLRSAKDVDARADIWSLGVVLYELLAGRLPFEGDTVGALFTNIVTVDPKPLRASRAEVSEPLEAVILRCLRRDARERFGDVAELGRALAPFGSGRAAKELARAVTLLAPPAGGGFEASPPPTDPSRSAAALAAAPVPVATQRAWQTSAEEARRGPRAGLVVGAAAIAVLVLGGGGWLALRAARGTSNASTNASEGAASATVEPVAVPAPPASASASATAPPAPTEPTPPPASAAASASSAHFAPEPHATSASPSKPTTAAKPRPAASATCNVVTEVDSDGQPHFRKVCK